MSTPARKDLPPVDSPMFLSKVRELLSTYLGNRGNVLDRGITVGDLSDAGVIKMDNQGNLTLGDAVNNTVAISGSTYQVDLKPPPTPTGFTVSTGVSSLIVQCDVPTYHQGHGHQKCRLYGTNNNSTQFSSAILLTEFSGHVGSFASNPATDWYLWLTWVSIDGVESVVPAGGQFGLHVTTGQDVSSLLNALNSKLSTSQLDASLNSRINLIDGPASTPGTVAAQIKTVTDAQTAANAATASSITALQASIGSVATTVQTEATARATTDAKLYAQYTVKIDSNGYVTGFGLASSTVNATPTSEFIIRADAFRIASPYGPGIQAVTPFTVVTTPTTVNGVTVPVGVYMDAAYIKDGTITNAKIANASIDSAKITDLSADKITAGTLQAGAYIQSAPFVMGTGTNPGQGWKLDSTSGTLYANQAFIWGTVYASGGLIGGNSITSSAVSSPNYSPGEAGWSLSSADGTLSALRGLIGNAVIDGTGISSQNYKPGLSGWKLDAVTGTLEAYSGHFLGDISGATGTFSGRLAAGTVDFASSVGVSERYPNPTTTDKVVTYMVPPNVTKMRMSLQAGGGGGGGNGAYNYGYLGSGGGGGGEYGVREVSVTPGQTLTITIGGGGKGGTPGSTGATGGSTSVYVATPGGPSLLLKVSGGGGGMAPQGGAYPGYGGISGGSGGSSGQAGNGGYMAVSYAAGAGGAGGNSAMGKGGAASTDIGYSAAIYDGSGYGAGGGGTPGNTNYGKSGGNGSGGYALIEFFDPNGVVPRAEFESLKSQLRALGMSIV